MNEFLPFKTGQTTLHYACALGQVDIVIYLLNRQDCKLSEQDQVSTSLLHGGTSFELYYHSSS